ncbi:MAG: class I SAM-dependent methyltransferase [Eubacterium sp.]|nr:class I SAM-dependent methyltransferase [Eubacterium sp.]
MTDNELREYWLSEQDKAHIKGWDFSYINDRYSEDETLPWDYTAIVKEYLKPTDKLLDIDTGGGELVLRLGHPYGLITVTEAYPPNVELCRKTLTPLGVTVIDTDSYNSLPFEDESFDIIINRHGEFDPPELFRLLKPGGIFITQQVGEDNDRELVELLLPGTPKPFSGLNLADQTKAFESAGFTILHSGEEYGKIKFYDVGALVWFARVIVWEFPEFSVEKCFDRLLYAHKIIRQNGFVGGRTHRYMIAAKK